LCFAATVSALHVAPAATARPNIIVILADDMGFSDLCSYGSEIPTPNLDALAAKGARFSQFYNTGRCCPTRALLITGHYAHQSGIGHMNDDQELLGFRGFRAAFKILQERSAAFRKPFLKNSKHYNR
jgi:arylsulfatase A-like enzyme